MNRNKIQRSLSIYLPQLRHVDENGCIQITRQYDKRLIQQIYQ